MPAINEQQGGHRQFILQWHLTARCQEHCRHCYMHDSPTYDSEVKNELSTSECMRILDDFSDMTRSMGVGARINFSGGDPLLRKDMFTLAREASSRGFMVGILGNPHLLTLETARRLLDSGVSRYQISIDGLERTHDSLRGRAGAFRDALRAIKVLDQAGLPSVVMFTVSRLNAAELVPVIELSARRKVRVFDFARLVPGGTGKGLAGELLGAREYRQLLLDVLDKYRQLERQGCDTYFGRKENLWTLLYQELGLLPQLPHERGMIYSGCSVGSRILTILADGTVLACRRLPVKLGKAPGQHLREIFISSKNHRQMRTCEKMKKCGKCELLPYCRGCMAVAYGARGDFLAGDPQCWKVVDGAEQG
jgi:radical SAM/SPASM domain protein of ACGX system